MNVHPKLLPGACQIPIRHERHGIYFLVSAGEVVYVGQSVSPESRVINHAQSGWLDFDSAFCLRVPQAELNEVESAFIRYFRPPQNFGSYTKRWQVPVKDPARDPEILARFGVEAVEECDLA